MKAERARKMITNFRLDMTTASSLGVKGSFRTRFGLSPFRYRERLIPPTICTGNVEEGDDPHFG